MVEENERMRSKIEASEKHKTEIKESLRNHQTMVNENERMRSKIEALVQQKTEMKESLRIKIESELQSKNIELEQLEHMNVTLKQKVEDLEKQFYEFKQLNNKIDEQFQSVCKERDELKNRIHSAPQLHCQLDQKNNLIAQCQKIREQQIESNKKNEEAILALRREKDDLQTRLSRVVGELLTKGTPSITDFWSPNRPTKIADKYDELYINEWTDALDINHKAVKKYYHGLKNSEIEEIIIRHLHRLLKCCYKDCLVKADEQMQTLGKAFAETMCLTFNSEEFLSMPLYKEATVFRRAKSEKYAKQLFENQILCSNVMNDWNYNYKNEKVMGLLMTSPFFEKCVYCCWGMAIQDRVIYLDEDVPADTQIDKNTYKEFSKNGNTVAFVVWPALFLHKVLYLIPGTTKKAKCYTCTITSHRVYDSQQHFWNIR